jgi:hypothetical protein
LSKFHFLKAQLPTEVYQLSAGPFLGILQDPAIASRSSDVIDGVPASGLFKIFVESS